MAGGGIGEAMLLGAAGGGITSLLQDKDPLQGILLGGALGGAGGYLFGAGGGAGGGAASGGGGNVLPAMTSGAPVTEPVTGTLAQNQMADLANVPSFMGTTGQYGIQAIPNQVASGAVPVAQAGAAQAGSPSLLDLYNSMSPMQKLGTGVVGSLALSGLNKPKGTGRFKEEEPDWERWKSFRPTFYAAQGGMVPEYAGGGGIQNLYTSGYGPLDEPMQMQVPNQQELSSVPAAGYLGNSVKMMASGGISSLGSYSDGGRLLKGPGDGMSDHIPASIGGKQPARLAEGEFVIPADVVSHLGNGSTDAGAKQLYAMMSRIRKARTGSKKQGRQINPRKLMVA